MIVALLALLIGVVAGLRTFTAPTAVSWAAHLGWLPVGDSTLAFMGYAWTPWILTLLALVEFVLDQLPSTPSRTVPMQFGARIVSAALSGATIGAAAGSLVIGGVAGIVGAVIGTYGGRCRARAPGGGVSQGHPGGLDRGCRRDRRGDPDRGGSPMTRRFDAIIIGTGQAGPPLAGRLTAAGMSVAIVERKLFGGTCVNTGCMPTKTLVASAYAAHLACRAADYGVVARCGAAGRHGAGQGAGRRGVRRLRAPGSRTGCAAWSDCTVHHRPCPVRRAGHGRGRRREADRAAHLHQCRRPGSGAGHAGHRRGRRS